MAEVTRIFLPSRLDYVRAICQIVVTVSKRMGYTMSLAGCLDLRCTGKHILFFSSCDRPISIKIKISPDCLIVDTLMDSDEECIESYESKRDREYLDALVEGYASILKQGMMKGIRFKKKCR